MSEEGPFCYGCEVSVIFGLLIDKLDKYPEWKSIYYKKMMGYNGEELTKNDFTKLLEYSYKIAKDNNDEQAIMVVEECSNIASNRFNIDIDIQ